MHCGKSFICIENNMGPRTVPCGTLDMTGIGKKIEPIGVKLVSLCTSVICNAQSLQGNERFYILNNLLRFLISFLNSAVIHGGVQHFQEVVLGMWRSMSLMSLLWNLKHRGFVLRKFFLKCAYTKFSQFASL